MAGCANPPEQISVGSDPVFGEANPFGIAVDQATDTIYTANIFNGEGPGTVSVINGATCNAHNTSGCGQTPADRAGRIRRQPHRRRPDHQPRLRHQHRGHQRDHDQRQHLQQHQPAQAATTREREPTVGDYPSSISVDSAVDTAYVADIEGVSLMALTHRPWSSEPDTSGSG